MSKRQNTNHHIYQAPEEKNGKWIFTKTYLSEIGGVFISNTKEEADKKLRSLVLLNMSVTDEFTYEFEKDGEFYYITHPDIDRETGTYSFSIKKLISKETVKFIDNIENLPLALIQQKKICGIEIPKKPVKEKTRKKIVKVPRILQPVANKKKLELNIAKQQEAYIFVKTSTLCGFSKKEILENLQFEYQINEKEAQSLITTTELFFSNAVADSQDIPNIIQSHIANYEKIYKYFESTGNTIGMNKAMLLKEKLLGYHSKDTVFEFNQENNINLQKPDYNLTVLQPEEKDRLNHYLSKINATTIK